MHRYPVGRSSGNIVWPVLRITQTRQPVEAERGIMYPYPRATVVIRIEHCVDAAVTNQARRRSIDSDSVGPAS